MVSFLFVGIEGSLLTSSHNSRCLVVKSHGTATAHRYFYYDLNAKYLLNYITFVMQSMFALRKYLD